MASWRSDCGISFLTSMRQTMDMLDDLPRMSEISCNFEECVKTHVRDSTITIATAGVNDLLETIRFITAIQKRREIYITINTLVYEHSFETAIRAVRALVVSLLKHGVPDQMLHRVVSLMRRYSHQW